MKAPVKARFPSPRFLLRTALCAGIASVLPAALAHSPFIAPQAFIVDGKAITAIGGFAESPYSSEFPLKGFVLTLTGPGGSAEPVETTNLKTATVADLEVKEPGTYRLQASRENRLDFAQADGRWLRILDIKRSDLPPLSERPYILKSEVTSAMEQTSSLRQEQLVSYFTRDKLSDGVLAPGSKGLDVRFATHPNALKSTQPVKLGVTLDGKAQSGYGIAAIKRQTVAGEEARKITGSTDAQGQAELVLAPGQYLIEVTSPEPPAKVKPAAVGYRQNIAIQVD